MGALFGGKVKNSSTATDDARKSREANRIAQERQLQQENEADRKASGGTRRRPSKGRRLFEEGTQTLGDAA
ncbi:hypothetical protein [Roseibium album]|uniref:hypothetical protein n=1 Tax=Roseibium album TaxID=311410 RepID=UPI0024920B05|nr:hypothetical protein [Roseibium album]